MSILKGKCTKCGVEVKLDMGSMTKEEAITLISRWGTFECPGHHVELCSPYPRYWNLDEWGMEEGKALTEEEFVANLKAKYKEVQDTDGMRGLITGFAYGMVDTNDGKSWDFVQSPAGKRYYITND